MSLAECARRLTHLRTDAGKGKYPATCSGRAPHKPLLLLSVMDLIAEGTPQANLVEPTPDLVEIFALYWSKVMPADRRGLLAYPFSSCEARASGTSRRFRARKTSSRLRGP